MVGVEVMEEQATDVAEEDIDSTEPLGREEQKHRFVVLRAKGYSYVRIARELGVSNGTLTAWGTELEAEIAEMRAMELEALQSSSCSTRAESG